MVLDAGVRCRLWGVCMVPLELVVGVDLRAPVDEGTCSLKIAETHYEDAPLMLEQSPCHTVSMRLASMIEVRRPECWHGRDGLFWTLRERPLVTDLVLPCWPEP